LDGFEGSWEKVLFSERRVHALVTNDNVPKNGINVPKNGFKVPKNGNNVSKNGNNVPKNAYKEAKNGNNVSKNGFYLCKDVKRIIEEGINGGFKGFLVVWDGVVLGFIYFICYICLMIIEKNKNMSLKNTFLIIVLILFSFEVYSQDIELDKLWVGSYRIFHYEPDNEMHSDTTEYLSAVLWFTESEVYIVKFRNDYTPPPSYIDTISYEYKNFGDIIIFYDDSIYFMGVIENNILKIGDGYWDATFLTPNVKVNSEIDIDLINSNLINGVWEINLDSLTIYEEFLPDNKYKILSHEFYAKWYLYKILDYYFIVTNYNDQLYLRLIEDISDKEVSILIFSNETIKRYTMIKTEED